MEIKLTPGELHIANQAYDDLGLDNRLNILQEELGEAVAAVSHFRRGRKNSQSELAEELADVLVVISSLFPLLEADVMYWVQRKFNRLQERLNNIATESVWGSCDSR